MTVYKSGKKFGGVKQAELTTLELFRIAPHGLYFLITQFRQYIEANQRYDKNHPKTLTRDQIDYLENVWQIFDCFLVDRPLRYRGNRITKKLRLSIQALEDTLTQKKLKPRGLGLPRELHRAAKRLIACGLRFIASFHLHDALIVRIPNRPTDWSRKKRVAIQIARHQLRHGSDTFPKFPAVLKRLNKYKTKAKFQLSARQYWNYKNHWSNGTYWHYFAS